MRRMLLIRLSRRKRKCLVVQVFYCESCAIRFSSVKVLGPWETSWQDEQRSFGGGGSRSVEMK